MNLIQRVTDILIKPDETWPRLEKEPSKTASSKKYLFALALIPALAMLIDDPFGPHCLLGINFRIPLIVGMIKVVGVYVLGVAVVLTMGHVVNSLAPSFGARASKAHALKLVTHASAAGFAGSIFFMEALWFLPGLVAIAYSIYLIHTGLPDAVRCSTNRNIDLLPMSLVWSVTIILIFVPLFAALRQQVWSSLDQRGPAASPERKQPAGGTNIDLLRLSEAAEIVIQASEKIDQAHVSGNQAEGEDAQEELESAMDTMASLVSYEGARIPLSSLDFKSVIPTALGSLQREPTKSENAPTVGRPSSSFKASYSSGGERVDLYIRDFVGGVGGFVAFANWIKDVLDQGKSKGMSRLFNVGERLIREEIGTDSVGGRINVLLNNGVMLEIHGYGMKFPALKQLVGTIKLGAIEAIQRPQQVPPAIKIGNHGGSAAAASHRHS